MRLGSLQQAEHRFDSNDHCGGCHATPASEFDHDAMLQKIGLLVQGAIAINRLVSTSPAIHRSPAPDQPVIHIIDFEQHLDPFLPPCWCVVGRCACAGCINDGSHAQHPFCFGITLLCFGIVILFAPGIADFSVETSLRKAIGSGDVRHCAADRRSCPHRAGWSKAGSPPDVHREPAPSSASLSPTPPVAPRRADNSGSLRIGINLVRHFRRPLIMRNCRFGQSRQLVVRRHLPTDRIQHAADEWSTSTCAIRRCNNRRRAALKLLYATSRSLSWVKSYPSGPCSRTMRS